MATDRPHTSGPLAKLSWYFSHAQHSVWDRFGSDQQQKMVEDDLTAGKSVAILLFALISTGLVMSIVSLLVILAES